MEVLAPLVWAAVFKTVGTQVNLGFGGFDSHSLPFFFPNNVVSSIHLAAISFSWFDQGQCAPNDCQSAATRSHANLA